jgi:2-polyprenyl-3-methyl-5-hydroxy-6-metoxy-1,4-benzoquinol methylase
VFIGNIISPEELAQAYSTLDENRYYQETADASAHKFKSVVRDLKQLGSPSARILDIGGGDGALLTALSEHGFNQLSLHEIPGSSSPKQGSAYDVYRDTDYRTIPDGSFDVVTMMDVLEHVPDPDWTISAVQRLLRPGGFLYVHTPVVTALDRVMHVMQKMPVGSGLGRAWQRVRTSIFHLQNYTPRALSLLLEKHQFEIVRLDRINELSWPLSRYVRVYLVEKRGVPNGLGWLITVLLAPIVRSRLNLNKAVLLARLRS